MPPLATCQIGKPKVKQQQPQPRILPKPNKLWLPCQIWKNKVGCKKSVQEKPAAKSFSQRFHCILLWLLLFFYFSGFFFFIFLVFCDLPSLIEWQQAKSFGSPTHTHTHADSFSHTHTHSVSLAQYKWPPWRFAWRRKICNKIYFHTMPTQTRDTHTHRESERERYPLPKLLCRICCATFPLPFCSGRMQNRKKESAKTQAKKKERREKRQAERARWQSLHFNKKIIK